ncbi:DgyrCDS4321 [Dimorphilus gyrociliatus]|uniref:DgyrCDS4321 n=1 Tax=Dimorphilus gyrociliatus TaxID=2664684 RepID=A0A7I8VH75_9ANNE|nr:DgyrCDS4321 [Dimorphilus gyrociliatus]
MINSQVKASKPSIPIAGFGSTRDKKDSLQELKEQIDHNMQLRQPVEDREGPKLKQDHQVKPPSLQDIEGDDDRRRRQEENGDRDDVYHADDLNING